LVYLLIIVAIGAIIFTALRSNTAPSADVPLSEVAALINAGKVKEIVVSDDDVKVETTTEAGPVTSHKDSNSDLAAQLKDLGVDAAKLAAVKYTVDRPPEWGSLLSTISFLLPGLIVVGLIYFMFRQAQGTNIKPCRLARAARACLRASIPR
jgi:cell division protease FtsH